MATLTKRATPRQAVVMRMVAGAVMNAGHAHPHWNISPRMASSIAKRAAGTLTAGWPDVLAAPRASSERGCSRSQAGISASGGQLGSADEGGRSTYAERPPLVRLRGAIGSMAQEARRTMQFDREEALIDVLRLISREMGQ